MDSAADSVEDERGELLVGLCVTQTDAAQDLPALDARHRVRDDVSHEGRMDPAKVATGDPFGDQLAHASRRRGRISLVDDARRRMSGEILEEALGGSSQGVGDSLQIGPDPLCWVLLRSRASLDLNGRYVKEVPHDVDGQLLLAVTDVVERGLRAMQPPRHLLECEVPEPFCEEQLDQLGQQLRPACDGGRSHAEDDGRELVSSVMDTVVRKIVLFRAMPAERMIDSPEARDIVALARDVARAELAPRAAEAEADERFPREVFCMLGSLGILGMPYPETFGGGGQSYEVYLQVLEELASAWASVALGVSVHTVCCFPLAYHGTDAQRERWLPEMLAGEQLGGYCLSEPHAGSDAAALRTRAARTEDRYRIDGNKAWVTHGGRADFYTLFARTAEHRTRGISCFLIPGETTGLSARAPERKMGLTGSITAAIDCDGVEVAAERLIGEEGEGLTIALHALDSGRLGIAAVAVGLAQAALDHAVRYAGERETFGKPIAEHQGVAFMLADMEAAIVSARATTLEAARRRDRGLPFSRHASIAKLVATDAAMRVTTDAVQILGGYGYTKDFPVERYMREAKVMQIFEGTNQIQRMVIGRHLASRQ